MSNRVRNGRIGKNRAVNQKRDSALPQPYFFKPTPENRRLRPYKKMPETVNLSEWKGRTFCDMALNSVSGLYFIQQDILGEKSILASHPDLVTTMRSLTHRWYEDFLQMNIDPGLAKRGFRRETIPGSHFTRESGPKQVILSSDKTQFDHFIEMKSPYQAGEWAGYEKDVTFDEESLAALLPQTTDVENGRRWDAYPIRLSFDGVPVRIERLFIDDPEKKATYLTISPLGISHGAGRIHPNVERDFLYLTMKLDEEGKEPGWAEMMIGLPFHFSGALYSTSTVDLVDTRFEKIDDESVLRNGLRFELRGTVDGIDEAKISVKPDWLDHQALENEENLETMHAILHEGVEAPVVGEKYLIKGVIPPPDLYGYWGSRYKFEDTKLTDGPWKAFAFDHITE